MGTRASAERRGPVRPARAAGGPLRWRDRAILGGGLALGCLAVRLLGRTLRVVEVNRGAAERVWAAGGAVIYATWHGRMLMFPYLYGRARRVHVLASRSRDGEVVSRFVQAFGFRPVRGSTSRGASTALRSLARLLREERAEVALVPDGPRGPRYVAQPGPVLLAKLGRAPILPVGFSASPGAVLGSWDEFLVPYPFARAAVVFGEPLVVPADAGRDALEAQRQALETALRRVTAEADRAVGASRVRSL